MRLIEETIIETDLDFNTKTFLENNIEIENMTVLNNIKIFKIKNNNLYLNQLIDYYNFFKNFKNKLTSKKNNKPGILNYTDFDYCEFEIKRFFILNNFSDLEISNNTRGNHYNKNFDEIIIVNSGEIELEIISKTNLKIFFNLVENDFIYFPKNNWLNFKILDEKSILTILVNKILNESISIYDFNQYLLDF
jgi:hypothetical protein